MVNLTADGFPIAYSTGYIIFLTVVIVLGLSFALGWTFFTRRNDTYYATRNLPSRITFGRHCCNLVLLLSMEASVALLTWVAAMSPMNYVSSDEAPMIGTTGILIGTLFLWFPIVCLTDFLSQRNGFYLGAMALMGTAFLFLIIPGLTLLTVYCSQMDVLQGYDYFGELRITGLQVDSRIHKASGLIRDEYIMHFGKPKVGWGKEWACPTHPDKWCEALVFDPVCVICEGVSAEGISNSGPYGCQNEGNSENAKLCVSKRYNLSSDYSSLSVDLFNPDFDNIDLSPENDTMRWPSANFYADCDTCQAMAIHSYEVKLAHAEILKEIGLLLLIIGVCVYEIFPIWWAVSRRLAKMHRSRDDDSSSDEETVQHNNGNQEDPQVPISNNGNQEEPQVSNNDNQEDQV